jgi:hypothetical protein
VRDLKQGEWASEPKPEMYLPHSQDASPRGMTLVVRTSSDPLQIVPEVRREVWAIDRDLPVSEVASMEDVVAEAIGQQRFSTLLLGVFGAAALILAVVGHMRSACGWRSAREAGMCSEWSSGRASC